MPEHMLDEREVTQLQSAVRAALDDYVARRVLVDAGRRTGDYLLARRIPQAVQHILRCLPPALASRMLLAAIRRNAWTFSGSGHLSARYGPPVELSLKGCPLCHGVAADAPICDYYTATFERLFRELVSPRSVAREIACHARGANACVFEIVW
jgi:divinyl protochlorophyllide a 8-vinyl-reductase